MDSTGQVPDSEPLIELGTTLDQGPPVPLYMLADQLSNPVSETLDITTTQATIRLTTETAPSEAGPDASIILTETTGPVQTIYPGLTVNKR